MEEKLFAQLLKALEDWYADGLAATNYDSNPGHQKPSSTILFVHPYPGPPWRQMWKAADGLHRGAIIESLKDELYGIAHRREHQQGFSLQSKADRKRVYLDFLATGSKRHAATRFGISRDTVRRIISDHEVPAE